MSVSATKQMRQALAGAEARLGQSDIERASRTSYTVATVDEVPPGTSLMVSAGGHSIGIYNLDGSLHALRNFCPHEGAPICLGRVQGTNTFDEELGEYVRVLEGRILRCPWHQWEFDISTGRSIAKPERRLKTYDVEIAEGKVVVWV